MARRKATSVVAAVNRDLKRLGDDALAKSALAMTAVALAEQLDAPAHCSECGESIPGGRSAKASCAGRLRDVMTDLRALAPPPPAKDRLDEIAEKREQRRAAAGGPAT